jgi:porin
MKNKRNPVFLTALLLMCALLLTTAAWAEDSKTTGKDIWSRDKLTGDWWGGRTYLSDHGIDIDLRLSQYGQWVSSGGVDQIGEYGGTMDYRVNVDTNKLFGTWKGFSVNMHARTRFGEDVSAGAGPLALPNTGMLLPAPGDYNDTDITGLIANQYFPFGEKHLGLFTLGMLDIPDALTLFFPYVGYGQEGFWNVSSLVSAMPWFGAVQGLSLYGGWLATINKEHQIGQSAILVTGTESVSTTWGSVSDSFDDVWIAAFHRFLWTMDDKLGYFMVFGGVSTKDQASNDPHDFINIPGQGIVNTDEKNPWDIALYISQIFWQAEGNPKRYATFMMGGTIGPDNPQFAQRNFFSHVEAFCPMATRPHDRMGVAGWYNGLSDNFTDLVSPVADLRDLWGFEVYYNFAVTPWAHLSADLQLSENARESDDIAVIPGVRLVIDL